MILRSLIFLLLSAPLGFSASWYFDNAATAGSNNGTSWSNAWTNNAAITMASVNSGDTIYISGGSATKVYTETLSFIKDGASDSSRITIRVGQDTGHNGVADFGTNALDVGQTPYAVTVDGHRGLSYANPTNWYQVREGSWTNNIGFWFHDKVGTTGDTTDPAFQYFTEGTHNFTMRYVKVSGYTNTYSGTIGGSTNDIDERGIIFAGTIEPGDMTNVVWEFIYLDNNSGGQWNLDSSTNELFDAVQVRFCLITGGGEDHFKVPGGWSIHDNVIGPMIHSDVHADLFQLTGNYFKIYNNLIREPVHSYMRMQSKARFDPANPKLNHSILIYNNVSSELPGRGQGGVWNEGWGFVHWDSQAVNGGNLIWSNVWVVNNTYYGSISNSIQNVLRANPAVSWGEGTYVTNAYLYNINYLNNVWVDQHEGIAFPWSTNQGGGFMPFTTNDFRVNYNTVAGTEANGITAPRRFSYNGVISNMELNVYQFLNTTNRPIFVDYAAENFELASTDTAARNTGTNLSSILGGVFNFDSLNRARNIGGSWDRGALEAQETNLLIYLSFDNDAATTNATDDSGNGYTGKRFNLTEYSYPSNKIYNASGAPGLTLRPNFTGRYADFLWRTNNGTYNPAYLDDGSFYAVTNIEAAVTNLTQASIMTWARYNSVSRTDVASPDYSDDANAQLLSAGTATGTKGAWFLGRYNQRIWINNTRFVIQTNEGFSGGTSFGTVGDTVIGYGSGNQVIFEFPDWGYDDNGNTTNWHHYAVTFSNGVVRTYFDGGFVTNHTLSTMTVMNIGRGAGRPYNWIGVGVNTHVGTPEFENESGTDYPNNGWFNGGLDQVRIYNRSLTHQEIVDVANSEGAAFADAPSGGGGGGGGGITPGTSSALPLRFLRQR